MIQLLTTPFAPKAKLFKSWSDRGHRTVQRGCGWCLDWALLRSKTLLSSGREFCCARSNRVRTSQGNNQFIQSIGFCGVFDLPCLLSSTLYKSSFQYNITVSLFKLLTIKETFTSCFVFLHIVPYYERERAVDSQEWNWVVLGSGFRSPWSIWVRVGCARNLHVRFVLWSLLTPRGWHLSSTDLELGTVQRARSENSSLTIQKQLVFEARIN